MREKETGGKGPVVVVAHQESGHVAPCGLHDASDVRSSMFQGRAVRDAEADSCFGIRRSVFGSFAQLFPNCSMIYDSMTTSALGCQNSVSLEQLPKAPVSAERPDCVCACFRVL